MGEVMGVRSDALQGRRAVVVTGASAGGERATAFAVARRGWNVALLARGLPGLEGVLRDVDAAGGRAMIIPRDVADMERVFAAADRVAAECGAIDLWVNNAMLNVFGPNDLIPPAEFRRATEVANLGTCTACRPRCAICARATRGRSCRSAPRSPTA